MGTTRYTPTSALIVVDMQNDFAHPDGSLFVTGGDEIIATVNAEIANADSTRALVAYTQDWHPPVTPHFADHGGTWPVHCVRDTWGAELHRDLVVGDGAPVVRKGTEGEDGYSGFSMRDPISGVATATDLVRVLSERGIEQVVIVGLALDVCVKATAQDSVALGYSTIVVVEATRPVDLEPGDGERTLDDLAAAGVALV